MKTRQLMALSAEKLAPFTFQWRGDPPTNPRWDRKRTRNANHIRRRHGKIRQARWMMVCRRHGVVHEWGKGCHRCDRRSVKLTNIRALAGRRKKRDRRGPVLHK